MKRQMSAVLAILVIMAMLLAACGGGEATPAATQAAAAPTEAATAAATEAPTEAATAAATEAPTEAATAAATEAATAAATEAATEAASGSTSGPVTINFLGAGPGPGLDFDQAMINTWNKENPDIQVKLIQGPQSATDRYGQLLQAFQAQSGDIDATQIDVIWPGDLAEHLVDLYQYGAKEAVADDFPAIVTNNTVDGKLVGLPWFTDGGLLYYRTDLLEKYGYTAPPKTWAELEEMAQKIQDGERAAGNQDFWGFVWQGKPYEGLTCDALEWVYSSGGGTIVSPDKIITIDNEAAAGALDMAYNWIGKISPPGTTGFQEEESRAVWQSGNAAFMRNWPYAYNPGNADDSPIKGKFDVGPLPGKEAGQSAATLGGWQLAVSKYSKHPEQAAKFILWFGAPEQQKQRAIEQSLLPTLQALYKDPEIAKVVPFMPNLLPVFQSAVARPSTATAPHYNEVSTIFFQRVGDVLTGKTNGTDAVANISLDLEDLLKFPTGAPQ